MSCSQWGFPAILLLIEPPQTAWHLPNLGLCFPTNFITYKIIWFNSFIMLIVYIFSSLLHPHPSEDKFREEESICPFLFIYVSQQLGTLPAQIKYSINICRKMSNSVGGQGGDSLKKEEFNNVNTFQCFGEAKVRAENGWWMQHWREWNQ